ncbi:MAG: DNA alkylation repair protein [Bacteroidaceae bacterium]
MGKHDMPTLESYLNEHARDMHRTTLRYAIEKMDENKRHHYMAIS